MDFQDSLAPAFAREDPLPVTAVAAVIQHNTSGIISRKGEGMDTPKGMEDHVYATWDLPVEKAMIANRAEVDLFLSIHRYSYPTDNQVSGVDSLVYDLSGLKYEMAQNIHEQLETVGFVDLGVKARPDLVGLRRTQMPAVLVEAGFIDNPEDNRMFDEKFEEIAEAIAAGIEKAAARDEREKPPVYYMVQTGA